MRSAIKFDDFSVDIEKLKSELSIVGSEAWHSHFSGYDEGWTAIPLISLNGETNSEANKRGDGHVYDLALKYKQTPLLEQLPYFKEILDGFKCFKLRARIMRMSPGTNIAEHRDTEGWYKGIARMHLPIITHDEVYFYVDGKRVPMKEGELWYIDVTRPHKLRNDSDIVRVHLVFDLVLNNFVRDFFPKQTLSDDLYIFLRKNKKNIFNFLRETKFIAAFQKIREKN